MTRKNTERVATLTLLVLFLAITCLQVLGAPSGATISSASTETALNHTPGVRSDPRGTITTMILDAIQQDDHWKAYVGNVTGTLTLDDAQNFTIYNWDLTTISGEVYASRFGNITWTTVSCATAQTINNESAYFGMVQTDSDDINNTFNWSTHRSFTVGTNTINANTCNSTVTYANDTRQVPTANSPFQEVLIRDSTYGYMVYMTGIENNVQGFDNLTYDFQMIVADNETTVTPYYFYVELDS